MQPKRTVQETRIQQTKCWYLRPGKLSIIIDKQAKLSEPYPFTSLKRDSETNVCVSL